MKKSFLKGFLLILFSSTCFACSNGIEDLVDAGVPIIGSSSALVAEVKASSNLLGWGNIGDTTIAVKADKEILPALTSTKTDLKAITANLEGGFRLLSVGGSLSAGFRDGGLYREGQLTAFPNLVARQMGVTFYQPLFDASNGNGSGYKVLAGTEPIATFKLVTNNLGYVDNAKADKLKPFTGNNIDQYAFPYMNHDLGNQGLNENMGKKFSDRFFKNPNQEAYYNSKVLKNEFCDFFILEAGYDDVVAGIMAGGGSVLPQEFFAVTGGGLTIDALANNKAKGVLLNVPDLFDLPYFSQITNEKIKKLTGVVIRVQKSYSSEYYRDFNPLIDRLLPTATVEKLMRGEIKGLALLSDRDVLSQEEGDSEWNYVKPGAYNDIQVARKAKANNLAMVDMYNLYKKILAGTYTTDDGIKVNPDWKTGNFFSSDGIYPTAFGQAVIANEVIKTMNQFYKLTIPLVDTRFFLKK